jgi:hypothetical protein
VRGPRINLTFRYVRHSGVEDVRGRVGGGRNESTRRGSDRVGARN